MLNLEPSLTLFTIPLICRILFHFTRDRIEASVCGKTRPDPIRNTKDFEYFDLPTKGTSVSKKKYKAFETRSGSV